MSHYWVSIYCQIKIFYLYITCWFYDQRMSFAGALSEVQMWWTEAQFANCVRYHVCVWCELIDNVNTDGVSVNKYMDDKQSNT